MFFSENLRMTRPCIAVTASTVSERVRNILISHMPFGISGTSQHMVGCLRSRVIIGINIDKSAGIFEDAHFGIVADCTEFIPVLTHKLSS